MKKSLLLIVLFSSFCTIFSQEKVKVIEENIVTENESKDTTIPLDSIRNLYGARYVDYKTITYEYDTIQIDTTLTIEKYFRQNYIQKDDFELLAFANPGQTYNKLAYSFVNNQLTPKFGVTAKQYNFYEVDDVDYYHVPTPTTILFYNSGIDGQVLNSTFTTNFGKSQNFSIAYKGMRSIGDFQNSRASHVNFRTTYSYYNPKKRYQFRTHIVSQEIDHLENGGITDQAIAEFRDDNDQISARGRINVNLNDSESILKSVRYYYEHELRLLNSKDSLKQKLTNLKVGHSISHTLSKYKFNSSDTQYFIDNPDIFGTALNTTTRDRTELNSTKNKLYLKFNSPWILGDFKIFTAFEKIDQQYITSKTVGTRFVPKENETDYTSFGARWNSEYKGIFLNAFAEQLVTGNNLGSNLNIIAGFKLNNEISATTGIQLKSSAPNNINNFYQSNFSNLNWNNNFNNEVYRTLYGHLKTPWFKADLFLHQIENYTYFNSRSVSSQYNQTIDYIKLKFSNQLKLKNFYLNNTVMFQKVGQGNEVLRVPEIVTRNTFYYQNYLFKGDPLLAQIGFTFKYFSKYLANSFNPVLNEFYLQNNTKIGDYPSFDVFVNGEVRRTRIYFKVENITASFTGRDYFVTENQPAKDLTIRLGVVWNFWN
ncbi:putative porin [Wenyingzhuangia sp. IMCC45533]